ncbi:TICRR protein, partial [Urocolius indicus]|nr:TICRR protein [Urocolius indicus]
AMGRERETKTSEHCSSKVTNTLGEFELEGIYRLQDQASSSDSDPGADEDSARGTFGLKSRKRVFTYLSPAKEEKRDAKRSCTDRCSLSLTGHSADEGNRNKWRMDSGPPETPGACAFITPEQHSCVGDDEVFLLSGSTPPVKRKLSTSSLLALTQSPLLCPGHTPPAQRRDLQEESEAFQIPAPQELSPFHMMASRKRPLSRTYSRKKLLS